MIQGYRVPNNDWAIVTNKFEQNGEKQGGKMMSSDCDLNNVGMVFIAAPLKEH